jgi:simple sugar transport system permease protein
MDAEYPILLQPTRLHLGVLLAGVTAILVWLLMTRTTFGFAIRAVGENVRAAAHGGLPVKRVVFLTAVISGGLAGLAGVGEVAGLHFQVMASLSPGYGYTGIVIAMLARLNTLGVIPAAIFFAAIATGAETMSRTTGVPVFLADVIQGVSLICMLVALLFTTYRLRVRGSDTVNVSNVGS